MDLIKGRNRIRKTNMNDKYFEDYVNEKMMPMWIDELTTDERKAILGTMDYMLYALHREWGNLLYELSIIVPFRWFLMKHSTERRR